MSLFKNPKLIYRVLALIVLATVVYFASTHHLRDSAVDVTWPARSQSHTMLLRPASSPESVRMIDYAKDQVTVTAMRIEYRDGSTALVKYQSGLPTSIRSFYPEAKPAVQGPQPVSALKNLGDGLDSRKLQTLVEIKADGYSLKSIVSFASDGNIKSVAVRNGSDDVVVTAYSADSSGPGVSGVSKVSTYDGTSGQLKAEQVFRSDGSVESSFVTTSDAWSTEGKRTFFDASGLKVKEDVFKGDYDTSTVEYAADGKTIKQKTSYNYSDVTVTTYDATGLIPVLERVYYNTSRVSVRYFGPDGKAVLQQRWVKLDSSDALPVDAAQVGVLNDGYYLSEAYEFHPDGVSVKLDINFYPGGKTVKDIESRPTMNWQPRSIQHFREDGTLDSTDNCPAMTGLFTCNSVKATGAALTERGHAPAGFFKITPLLPVPSLDKPKIPKLPLRIDLR
jgi:hypothetical protein